MKGSSKVIMVATMAIVIILAIVLALVLVLLAELYCSILLRRRRNLDPGKPSSRPEDPPLPQQPQEQLVPSPLSTIYAQGVLEAPRSFLFPKLPSSREPRVETDDDIQKPKHGKLHQFLRVQSPQLLGLASSSSSQSPNFVPVVNPKSHQPPIENPKIEIEGRFADESYYSGKGKNFMYISNPIYDNEVSGSDHVVTPFETPDSSPSHLDRTRSGSSGSEGERENEKAATASPSSLPLSPMKELPAKAASVVLSDARSLCPSGSESNSRIGRSSSSSDSPRTSPSW